MPLANLLQPTCCHVLPKRTPRFQARGLSPLRLWQPSHPSCQVGAWHSTWIGLLQRWMAIAGSSSPGWPGSWRRADQPESNHHPGWDARCPGQDPTQAFLTWREPGDPTLMRPLSPSGLGWHPSLDPKGQDPRTLRAPPRTRFCGSETPSANESQRPLPGSRPSLAAWAATGAPTWPSKAQLPACFHAPTQGALDPSARRLFAAASKPHVARQLLQQSVPRARPRTARFSSWTAASRVPAERPDPLRGEPAELSQVRGRLALGTASTPTRATARLDGFTPT